MSTDLYKQLTDQDPGATIRSRVNFVTDFAFSGCTAPAVVWLKTFFPAAGSALLTLLAFSADDVYRGFARPKTVGRRSRYRSKKPKAVTIAGRRARLAIPEIGDLVGKQLRTASGFVEPKISKGVERLWVLDGVTQRALYHWLIADVVSDFAFQWTSELITTSGEGVVCEGGRFYASISVPKVHLIFFSRWPMGVISYSVGIDFQTNPQNSNQFLIPPGRYRCVFVFTVASLQTNTRSFFFHAGISGAVLNRPPNSEVIALAPNVETQLIYSFELAVFSPARMWIEGWPTGGSISVAILRGDCTIIPL